MSRSAEGHVRCGLCGHTFEPTGLSCHTSCPLGSRCGLICCPNCGYEVPDESSSALAKLLGRVRRPRRHRPMPEPREANGISSVRLAEGAHAEVLSLDDMPGSRSARLSAFGLVPGVEVTLRQRRPVPVLVIGQTEIAVSEEILEQIRVIPPDGM